ncbi:uncharacterized protein LOC128232831 isoform X2 [Mya arenaria]|uniref:uncharacterized protein LOC128232831 isoform X2 n=1 Tax=Mya arenaria TaxID=6604 RepID=UPI0022E661DC|nr:uncharacterized protein LOC128232831 isoform X2 [Mya arenaria]
MSSRRSRLQVKPNIGGVKGPVAKSATKQQIEVKKSEKKAAELEQSAGETLSIKQKEKKNENTVASDAKINQDFTTTSEKKTESPKLERARLRQFGKVNIAAVRKKPCSTTSEDKESSQKNVDKIPAMEEKVVNQVKTLALKTEEKDSSKSSIVRRSRFPKAKPNVDATKRKLRNTDSDTEKIPAGSKEKGLQTPPKKSKAHIIIYPPEDKPIKTQVKEPSEAATTLTNKHFLNSPNTSLQEGLPITASILKTPNTSPQEGLSIPMTPNTSPQEGLSIPMTPNTSPQEGLSIPITPNTSLQEGLPIIASVLKTPIVPKSLLKPPIPNIPSASPLKQYVEKRARTLSTSEPAHIVKRVKKPKLEIPVDQPPDRTKVKMRDLIHWNPSSNPMKIKAKDETKVQTIAPEKENVADNVKDVPEMGRAMDDTPLPVPQVTIGPDGNIVINEKSLVVDNPNVDKGDSQDSEVIDETDRVTTYNSFRTHHRARPWSKKDTTKFYKALAMCGLDFFLISQLFPKKTRLDVKKKFHKEERMNRPLVEKVLQEGIQFDATWFDKCAEPESSDEEVERKKHGKKSGKSEAGKKADGKSKARKRKTGKSDPEREQKKKGKQGHQKGLYTGSGIKKLKYYEELSDDEGAEEEEHAPHDPSRKDKSWEPQGTTKEMVELGTIQMDLRKGHHSKDGDNAEVDSFSSMRLPTQSPVDARGSVEPTFTATPLYQGADANQDSAEGFQSIDISANHVSDCLVANQSLLEQGSQSIDNPVDPIGLLPGSTLVGSTTMGLSQNIDGDQYVLVTVVPEGGGETVIHIYRVHGGLQGHGQVTPATEQVMNSGILGNAALPGSLTAGDVQFNLTASLPVIQNGVVRNQSNTGLENQSSSNIEFQSNTVVNNLSSTNDGIQLYTEIENQTSSDIGFQSSTVVENESITDIGFESSSVVENQSSTDIGFQSSTTEENQSSTDIGFQINTGVENHFSTGIVFQSSTGLENNSSPNIEFQSSIVVDNQLSTNSGILLNPGMENQTNMDEEIQLSTDLENQSTTTTEIGNSENTNFTTLKPVSATFKTEDTKNSALTSSIVSSDVNVMSCLENLDSEETLSPSIPVSVEVTKNVNKSLPEDIQNI